jgi:hypothetical protein
MQNIERPADIQALCDPVHPRRSRVDGQSMPDVRSPKSLNRIGGHLPVQAGRRPALGRPAAGTPAHHLVALAKPQSAAREAAAAIPVLECAPQRRRDRPGAGADFDHAPVLVVPHDDPARVARQTLRRSRGNAHAVLENRLSGLIRIREDRGVDVNHDLIALSGRARV